jgi:hypothetical protein
MRPVGSLLVFRAMTIVTAIVHLGVVLERRSRGRTSSLGVELDLPAEEFV